MPAAGNTALLMPAGGQPNTAQPTHNHHHEKPDPEKPELHALCADLERVAFEKGISDEKMEAVTEAAEQTTIYKKQQMTILRTAEVSWGPPCCRMLGAVNGRTSFEVTNKIRWGPDGRLLLC